MTKSAGILQRRKAAEDHPKADAALRDEIFDEAVAALTSTLNHELDGQLSTILSNTQTLLLTSSGCERRIQTRLQAIEAAAITIRHALRRAASYSRATFDPEDAR